MDKCIVVLTNTASLENAKEIARELIEHSLAACVNIIKNECSLYEWEGEVCEEQEFQLLIKSKKSLYGKIERRIVHCHDDDVPEIISLDIEAGSDAYLGWVRSQTI